MRVFKIIRIYGIHRFVYHFNLSLLNKEIHSYNILKVEPIFYKVLKRSKNTY